MDFIIDSDPTNQGQYNISNQFCIVDVVMFACFSIRSSAPPPKVDLSPPGGTPTAGETFSLTCSVTLEDGGPLTEDLTVQWEAPVDISMDSEIQVVTGDSTGTRTTVLQFTPVRASHGGQYTCKATTTTGTDMATATLTVQSEKLIYLAWLKIVLLMIVATLHVPQ